MTERAAKTLGVILAGGLARRMGGGDKALLPLGDTTLLTRAISRLAPQVDAVAVNSNSDPASLRPLTDLPIVPDGDDSRSGPLAGVLAGMEHARTFGFDRVVSAAVDTPFFPCDLVARLGQGAAEAGTALACAATGARTHPVFGLWSVALADDLRAALAAGTRKVDIWTARHGCAEVDFADDSGIDPFFNINTPEDRARAEAMLAGGA